MKKVMLIFPPEWVPTAPYLALPSLAAVLRQNGIETVLKDINVEMFDHFFTSGFLLFVKSKIQARLKALTQKEYGEALSPEDTELKQMLDEYQHIDLDHHINKVGRAKRIMRGPEFYDIEKAESLVRLEWVNDWDQEDNYNTTLRLRGKLQLTALSTPPP